MTTPAKGGPHPGSLELLLGVLPCRPGLGEHLGAGTKVDAGAAQLVRHALESVLLQEVAPEQHLAAPVLSFQVVDGELLAHDVDFLQAHSGPGALHLRNLFLVVHGEQELAGRHGLTFGNVDRLHLADDFAGQMDFVAVHDLAGCED